MFAIDKGIELPPARKGRSDNAEYPFAKMKVGDSFLVPVHGKTSPAKVTERRRSLARRMFCAKRSLGFTFSLRTMKDGIRIWRVK